MSSYQLWLSLVLNRSQASADLQLQVLLWYVGQKSQAKWCNNERSFPLEPELGYLISHLLEEHQAISKSQGFVLIENKEQHLWFALWCLENEDVLVCCLL